MKIVAMINKSAGNESIGDMWTETKVFDSTESLDSVYTWVASRTGQLKYMTEIIHNVKLSIDQSKGDADE